MIPALEIPFPMHCVIIDQLALNLADICLDYKLQILCKSLLWFAEIGKIHCSKIAQRTCEANAMGENSSFIFTVCVKSVPFNHFKLASWFYIWLSKNFSKPTS